ncbi:hypothetical protein DXG01_006911 [Tephrocybe rancida]|nr:hypothetical protein DXG01_006911 [Tephrocybe rancida]
MAKEKDSSKPRIEILLDAPYLFLKGVGVDVESTRLSGHVAIYLSEATPLKEITLQFRGKAHLPGPPSESSAPLTYIVCNHEWSFLEGDKSTSHTLKAGRHLFPFQLRIGGSLPSTMSSPAFGGAAVTYKLRAQVIRSGFFNQTYQAGLPVHIIRSFAPEAMEYQQTLEIENTWPEKLMYSIMVPHKAWAAGDKLTALVKFAPLVKGVCVLNVTMSIHEQTKVYARTGQQEQTRLVTSVKHEIVNGRAVEVEGQQNRHSHTPSYSTSPASPASPPPGFSHAHRTGSSNSLVSLSRQYLSTPFHGFTSTNVSTPSTPPVFEVPPPLASSSSSTAATAEELSLSEPDSQDVVTYLSIHVPLTITPTHSLEPIIVSHRIRWSILILNLNGHTSELRCSLPLHLLDYRLLNESRNFSAATRRLLIGGSEVPETEEEDVQLPSYTQHIRDRVANMFLPESATMRVTNPWISQHTSPVHFPDAPATTWPIGQSGHCTPLEAHLLTHLPHQHDPNQSNTPLEWVNSELLLSLSGNAPPRLRASSPHRESSSPSEPQNRSRLQSGPGSRVMSRLSSRASSPERGHDRNRAVDKLPAASSETYVHNQGNASRSSHGLFSTTMTPSTTFKPGGFLSRTSSSQQIPTMAELEAAARPAHPVRMMTVDRNSGTELLHRAFTEVPDYAVASRGFIGGVPPLSSMQGLPSYDETMRASEEDLTRRLGGMRMSTPPAPRSPPRSPPRRSPLTTALST